MLRELPALADALDHLAAADRHLLASVAVLADLHRAGTVEQTTGVSLEHWLAIVGRQTRMDRRLLLRCIGLLHRLPALRRAVDAGGISFAQLRGLTIALRQARRDLDAQLDRRLGRLLDGLASMERPDPDVLVTQVADALDELDPDDLADRSADATRNRFLHLQPRLDGTGGRVSADFDAVGLALLDAATTPPRQLLGHPDGYGAARADTLLARLAGSLTGPPSRTDDADQGGADDRHTLAATDEPDVAPTTPAPAAALGPPDLAVGGPGPDLRAVPLPSHEAWWDRLAPPRLLIRVSLGTLLDRSVPAQLLTRLVGGRLKLTAAAARRLADERGALLRTVIVDDDGTVIGVGRTTREPPGWLSDAVLSVHDTCTGPLSDRPALGADIDHATPWWPVRPDQPPGRTDVDDLGPLSPATNRAKEAAGWRATQTGAGVRTWTHPRSGLTCTTVPATWRPPPARRPGDPPDRAAGSPPPPGPAPPGGPPLPF